VKELKNEKVRTHAMPYRAPAFFRPDNALIGYENNMLSSYR
jgi:hypothetical protein